MSEKARVLRHRDARVLAAASGARLITCLADAQAARGTASVVLTGGGTGIATLAAVAASDARDALDWSRVDFWWGDERFLPTGDAERNETQARAALLDHLPIDPAQVHPMPASDGPDGDDATAAARRYADELTVAGNGAVPTFDVLLLGVGEEGHVASIFPDSPAVHAGGAATAVFGSPKPPPTRISLTFAAITSAAQVWVIAAGANKAPVLAAAARGAEAVDVPVAGARGRERTLWLLDDAAASDLR